jgi:hypothetical protein
MLQDYINPQEEAQQPTVEVAAAKEESDDTPFDGPYSAPVVESKATAVSSKFDDLFGEEN